MFRGWGKNQGCTQKFSTGGGQLGKVQEAFQFRETILLSVSSCQNMGSVIGKTMEENFKKQQEFMEKNQEVMLDRQIQMQNQMRERQAAMMVARSRDMLNWWGAFYVTVAFFGIVGFLKTKKPVPLIPLLPFSFIVGYQYDLAYGNKMQRCREEAERVMAEEGSYIELPRGLPTVQSIDAARNQ
ncbi:hypothetical protein DPMN_084703 [Dreissena polymorpha]|uniref:Plasminogen receptor (KT) n=1 Tax=Dreissena polymorpha TaxID=45954 RepID=A0A9D3YB13_DREPO|nr:hypothetical protein DPMN_084703 [Dreissena polymorpha]